MNIRTIENYRKRFAEIEKICTTVGATNLSESEKKGFLEDLRQAHKFPELTKTERLRATMLDTDLTHGVAFKALAAGTEEEAQAVLGENSDDEQ